MSGWRRHGGWHERRIPSRCIPAGRDPAPDGCPRRLRRRRRVRFGCGHASRNSSEHREAAPRRLASSVGTVHRATDLCRRGRWLARRSRCRVTNPHRTPRAGLGGRELTNSAGRRPPVVKKRPVPPRSDGCPSLGRPIPCCSEPAARDQRSRWSSPSSSSYSVLPEVRDSRVEFHSAVTMSLC